jgi:D-amino-acid dehydrogenase
VEPRAPGGRHAASFGNAGWISPASIIPMSMPGLWAKVPGLLRNREGPLTIRWRHLPALLPWLLRFLAAGATVTRVERTAAALHSLLRDAPGLHLALASEIGRPDLIERSPLLYVYPDRSAFAAEALAWRIRRANGLAWTELDSDALRRQVPALSSRYTFAVCLENAAFCRDPGDYVATINDHLDARGVERVAASATSFDVRNGCLRAVHTDVGAIDCDHAVIAAGIGSKAIARQLGQRIPLESERGYHVCVAGEESLSHPVMPSDGKMGITPTAAGLRVSGQVELASVSADPDWRRADLLLKHLQATVNGLATGEPVRIDRWMGHRPSTPDGRPVIDVARACSQIVLAFGHGHVGLASAPSTARIVAGMIADGKVAPKAFRADRF